MSSPNRFFSSGVSLLLLALATPLASAQTKSTASPQPSSAPAAPLAEEAPTASTATPKLRRPVNPIYPQIAVLLDAEREQLAALRLRLAATRDANVAMGIQREIEQVKVQTEVGILRLQADHARKQGRTAAADGLEAAIRQMLQPPVRGAASTRPAPATDAPSTPTR